MAFGPGANSTESSTLGKIVKYLTSFNLNATLKKVISPEALEEQFLAIYDNAADFN